MTIPLTPTDVLACPADVLSRVLDGEAVLLHLGSGTYFGMNPVATRAWELIVGGTTFGGLCTKLEGEFDVPGDQLAADMRDFVAELLAQKLITLTPSSAA